MKYFLIIGAVFLIGSAAFAESDHVAHNFGETITLSTITPLEMSDNISSSHDRMANENVGKATQRESELKEAMTDIANTNPSNEQPKNE